MIDMLKRHEIQVLRRAGHAQVEVAKLAGAPEASVAARVSLRWRRSIIRRSARRDIGRPARTPRSKRFFPRVAKPRDGVSSSPQVVRPARGRCPRNHYLTYWKWFAVLLCAPASPRAWPCR